MSDIEYLDGLFSELDEHRGRIADTAAGSDEQHAAVDSAAAAVYRLRQKVKAGYPGKKAFYAAAAESPDGVVVEGITALYGKHAHEFVRSLSWARLDTEVVADQLDDDQVGRYRAVAGRGVVDTFGTARDYLWTALHPQ